MIKALLLIFEPIATWDRIALARRGPAFLLFVYLLPMLLIGSAAEGYGLMRWGEWQRDIGRQALFSPREAGIFEAAQLLLILIVVLISAKVIKSLGDTFHSRHTFTQALTISVYGLSPWFLVRVIDAFPISPWIAWSVGLLLAVAILYHGVPRVMEPDPSHAFGLYLTSSILLMFITAILRLATASYLEGKFPELRQMLV
jgi:hypothetical protein